LLPPFDISLPATHNTSCEKLGSISGQTLTFQDAQDCAAGEAVQQL